MFDRRSLRRAFGPVSLLWLSSLGAAAVAFLTQVFLARTLPLNEFGEFAASMATITLVAPMAAFGVPALWLRLFGAEGWGARRWLLPSAKFATLTTAISLATLALWAQVGAHDATSRHLLIGLAPLVISQALVELVASKFQLEEHYRLLAVWHAAQHLARLALVLIVAAVVSPQYLLHAVVASYAAVAVATIILALFTLRPMIRGNFHLRGHPAAPAQVEEAPSLARVAKSAWPFGLAGLFYMIYFQSDIIILERLSGNEQAAIYNVAFMMIAAIYILPAVLYQKFLLPKVHRWASHDRPKFNAVYRSGSMLMLIAGILVAATGFLVLPLLVPLLFGEAYSESVPILLVLLLCVPLRFAATSVGSTLVTDNHMRRKVVYMGASALLNLALNFSLIPHFGPIGAAAATLASEALLLVLYFVGAKRYVFNQSGAAGDLMVKRYGREFHG